MDVNGIINVNGVPNPSPSSVITITATNSANVPTLNTSANGQYNYLEFTAVDTYTITLNTTVISNFNYVLVGPGGYGTASNPYQPGGGGGGYIIGPSIINNNVPTDQMNMLKGMFSQMRSDKKADDADDALFERYKKLAGL